MFRLTKKRAGYTLIEFVVTIAIITLIGAAGLPQIAQNSDRARLESAANNIRQIILSARTNSLSPGGGDHATKQVFDVRMGTFETVDTQQATASGNRQTNRVEMLAGVASCGETVQIAQEELIREYRLPRGIYISKFYPTNDFTGDRQVFIRFSVGRIGFVCGAVNSSAYFDSTNHGSWIARDGTGQTVFAKYLIIELSSRGATHKKYIAVDRQTGEVFTSNSDPQEYLTPTNDSFAPEWSSNPLDVASFARINVRCFTFSSEVTLSFNRARDRIGQTATDPNLAVFYDISWGLTNDPARFEPLAISYYYNVARDIVRYAFTTDRITIPNQPTAIFFRIAAKDSIGNIQAATETNPIHQPAIFSLSPQCGARPIEEDDTPDGSVDQGSIVTCDDTVVGPIGRPTPACPVPADWELIFQ